MEGICKRCRAPFPQHPFDPWPICPVCRNELTAEEVRGWAKGAGKSGQKQCNLSENMSVPTDGRVGTKGAKTMNRQELKPCVGGVK